MISILKEDNVLSMTAKHPYGPPMNTDIDYYRTFWTKSVCCDISCAAVARRRDTNTCLIMLSTKKGSNCLHINAFGMAQPEFEPTTSRFFSGCSNPQPPGQVLNLDWGCRLKMFFYLELNEADL